MPIREDSLFALLLRAPWWVSFLLAAGVFAVLRLVLRVEYAAAIALPIAATGVWAGWHQLRTPSGARLDTRLEALRGMSWENFAFVLEQAWRTRGYRVERHAGRGADYVLDQGGRVTLVACKRWKAKRTGVEPLRALDAAARARHADEALYFAAGEVTEQARDFVANHAVTLVNGVELIKLVPRARRRERR